MRDIGKGDWVECVKDGLSGRTMAANVYFVERVTPRNPTRGCRNCGGGHAGLRMAGLTYRGSYQGECPDRFRPLGGHHERTETHSRDRVPA